jgi:putative permease
MNILSLWFRRYFSDPQVIILLGLLLIGFVLLGLVGQMLAPVIASVIVAYLLEGTVGFFERLGVPRKPAVAVVFLLFLATLLGLFFVLLPLLISQIAQLVQQLPAMLGRAQDLLIQLPERYPDAIDEQQVRDLIGLLRNDMIGFGQRILALSVEWLPTIVTLGVYLILMPMLVFYFLMDKDSILNWVLSFLPNDRPLADQVWREVRIKIGSYVRGKAYEMLIVALVTYVAFLFFGLDFSALLATATGISVLIPFIGVILAAVPVVLVAYSQWGAGNEFLWLMGTYTLIQFLDGYLLQPLLMSGVVDLHPTAVIVAILVFGGIWGFWGVFFAIPLASLVQAVLNAWPLAEGRGGGGSSTD